ncbi:PREDICTED: uncharacterized protein LOC105950963 [Erythranthe guttata]|uniref:uncharacterized protein LOC105950963 n=1 Tax=Erythranthe guttata TaxID=4155 RepID=UPI00064DD5FC|nr:PREDICTED: uncharacterized protein LOC105950963 [Erythranthe guttata]|eukprot:XP_012829805.1 PREDICTED: uncharacterized protein LOC105950963 [Erythranthe guttata]
MGGIVYAMFKDVCCILGMMEDENEYIGAIRGANGLTLSNSSMDDTELVLDELDYDDFAIPKELKRYLSSITDKHRRVYDATMDAASKNCDGMYFLLSGNKFTWRTLSAAVRLKGKIFLNHYTAESTGKIAYKGKTYVWDEAPMMHKYCLEALEKTMRSITHVPKPFCGKVIVLGGDIKLILPVVLKASRQDIIHTTINSHPLWKDCKVLKLHMNMRLQSSSNPFELEEINEFADWILSIGNGDAGEQNDCEASVEIPEDMLIPDSEDPLLELLKFVYPDLLSNISNPDYFQGSAMLALTNDCVEFFNNYLCSLLPSEEKLYLNADCMCKDEMSSEENAEIYTTEFLNTVS